MLGNGPGVKDFTIALQPYECSVGDGKTEQAGNGRQLGVRGSNHSRLNQLASTAVWDAYEVDIAAQTALIDMNHLRAEHQTTLGRAQVTGSYLLGRLERGNAQPD